MISLRKDIENELCGSNGLIKLLPSTRYQGSKRRIVPWLFDNLRGLKFDTVLDGFGGTGSVSYLFKLMGKKIVFNDVLWSNYQSGIALIENDSVILKQNDLKFLLQPNGFSYPSFIHDTFKGIYYLNSENKWLDMICFNIDKLSDIYSGRTLRIKRALSYHALFQACLSKRPFNLFHRKNLSLRKSTVKRTFGNKATWDTDFKTLFLRFHDEISQKIFSNRQRHKAICRDIMQIKDTQFDLVYLDPPYMRPGEKSPKDYFSMYHFLEGMVDYSSWPRKIDWNSRNRRLVKKRSSWDDNDVKGNFNALFEKFQDSVIVVSYGDPGTPSVKTITRLLRQYKSKVVVLKKRYNYRLNRGNGNKMYEVLIIGR